MGRTLKLDLGPGCRVWRGRVQDEEPMRSEEGIGAERVHFHGGSEIEIALV
jgi:hypothetical protein